MSFSFQENGYTPLMVACTISDSVAHVAELLLQNGARPDGDPQVLLICGVMNLSFLNLYLFFCRLIADL